MGAAAPPSPIAGAAAPIQNKAKVPSRYSGDDSDPEYSPRQYPISRQVVNPVFFVRKSQRRPKARVDKDFVTWTETGTGTLTASATGTASATETGAGGVQHFAKSLNLVPCVPAYQSDHSTRQPALPPSGTSRLSNAPKPLSKPPKGALRVLSHNVSMLNIGSAATSPDVRQAMDVGASLDGNDLLDVAVNNDDGAVDEDVTLDDGEVDEDVTLDDGTVDDSEVDEDVALNDGTVNEDVALDDGTVDEDDALNDDTVDEDVGLDDGAVDEDVALNDGTVDDDVALVDGTVDEDVTLDDGAVDVVGALDSGCPSDVSVFDVNDAVNGDVALDVDDAMDATPQPGLRDCDRVWQLLSGSLFSPRDAANLPVVTDAASSSAAPAVSHINPPAVSSVVSPAASSVKPSAVSHATTPVSHVTTHAVSIVKTPAVPSAAPEKMNSDTANEALESINVSDGVTVEKSMALENTAATRAKNKTGVTITKSKGLNSAKVPDASKPPPRHNYRPVLHCDYCNYRSRGLSKFAIHLLQQHGVTSCSSGTATHTADAARALSDSVNSQPKSPDIVLPAKCRESLDGRLTKNCQSSPAVIIDSSSVSAVLGPSTVTVPGGGSATERFSCHLCSFSTSWKAALTVHVRLHSSTKLPQDTTTTAALMTATLTTAIVTAPLGTEPIKYGGNDLMNSEIGSNNSIKEENVDLLSTAESHDTQALVRNSTIGSPIRAATPLSVDTPNNNHAPNTVITPSKFFSSSVTPSSITPGTVYTPGTVSTPVSISTPDSTCVTMRVFECTVCSFTSLYKAGFTRHLKHHGLVHLQCPFCPTSCTTRKQFLLHVATAHDTEEDESSTAQNPLLSSHLTQENNDCKPVLQCTQEARGVQVSVHQNVSEGPSVHTPVIQDSLGHTEQSNMVQNIPEGHSERKHVVQGIPEGHGEPKAVRQTSKQSTTSQNQAGRHNINARTSKRVSNSKGSTAKFTRNTLTDSPVFPIENKPAVLHAKKSAVHGEKNRFCCDLCSFFTCGPSTFAIHMSEHALDRDRSLMTSHTEVIGDIPTIVRRLCASDGRYHCEWCTYVTSRKASFTVHLRIHQKLQRERVERSTRCVFCSEQFQRQDQLAEHVTAEHPDGLVYDCDQCHYQATDEG